MDEDFHNAILWKLEVVSDREEAFSAREFLNVSMFLSFQKGIPDRKPNSFYTRCIHMQSHRLRTHIHVSCSLMTFIH